MGQFSVKIWPVDGSVLGGTQQLGQTGELSRLQAMFKQGVFERLPTQLRLGTLGITPLPYRRLGGRRFRHCGGSSTRLNVDYSPWFYTPQWGPLARMDFRAQLGENVRKARLAVDLSQEDLAHRAGLDRTYVSGIERGVRNPTVMVLILLANELKIHPADLLQGIGDSSS